MESILEITVAIMFLITTLLVVANTNLLGSIVVGVSWVFGGVFARLMGLHEIMSSHSVILTGLALTLVILMLTVDKERQSPLRFFAVLLLLIAGFVQLMWSM